jgi:transcriptional regulator
VPTWNYVAVHVYGKIQLIDDPQALAEIVTSTTNSYEQSQPSPWAFDSSTTYAERMLPQIIGFRLSIERIEGKWKISQNHPLERQQRVIHALRNKPSEDAQAIADLMETRLPTQK